MSGGEDVQVVLDAEADLASVSQLADALANGVRFVQGAGGNLSVKADGVLWVKASGTRFSDATSQQIFVPMDLARTRDRALKDERLEDCVISFKSAEGLRPSIEAAFHAVLPHRVVLHVHSVGAIAASVESSGRLLDRIRRVGPLITVPYARPGLPLAQALVSAGAGEISPATGALVLLQNHGLIVGAPTAMDCLRMVTDVEAELGSEEPLPLIADAWRPGWVRRLPPSTIGVASRIVLAGGVLTPDSAVFLGPSPFSTSFDQSLSAGVIDEYGALWTREDLSGDALQIVQSLISIAASTVPPAAYLSSKQVQELVGWDAEAWRKAQER